MAGSRRKIVNTKRSGNTRGTSTSTYKKKTKTTNSAKKTTKNTQKLGVNKQKSTTTNKNTTVSGRATRNDSARKANTGSQKTTQKKSFDSRMNTYQGTSGNRRKQMTEQAKKTQQKSAKDTTSTVKNLTKGNLKTIAGSHETTFHSIRNPNEEMYRKAEEFKRQRGDYDNQKKSPYSDGQYAQLVNRERDNKEQREKNLKRASRKIDEGTKIIEKEKESMGKGGKFAADLYGAGLGLASDALAGPASMVSMFSRSYGSAYKTAKDEGANDSQAALYGASIGGLEAATEKMFAIAKPLQKVYGKGAADDLTERVLDKMVKKAATQGGRDVVYHGGKTVMAAISEGLEEMVAEGLDPVLANQIYANALGVPHEMATLEDYAYAFALGGAMGGLLGGGGQIVEYGKGKKISDTATEIYGEGGVNEVISKGLDIDEDAGGSLKAETYREMITSGGIAMGQVAEMAREVEAQRVRDENRFSDADNAANRKIKEQSLDNIMVVGRNEKGEVEVGLTENAQNIFNENLKNNIEAIGQAKEKLQLPEMTDEQVRGVAEAIAGIQTGVVTMSDISLFTLRNPENRAMFEEVTGVKLPNTNQKTKTMLFEMMAEGRVESAKSQTAWRKDQVRGEILQNIAPAYESAGQGVLLDNVDTINADNMADAELLLTVFDNAYNAGRAGMPYSEYKEQFKEINMYAPRELREAAYAAGLVDKKSAFQSAEQVQLQLGQKVEKSRSQAKSGAHRGKLTVRLAPENKGKFGAQEQIFYKAIATALNIEIRVVDNIKGNGTYVDGIITMNVNGDRNLGYIFFHELTHHLEKYAPQEYQRLKEHLRKKWEEKDPEGYRAALEEKKSQYALQDVKLTNEEAFDEILADGTYEFLQDESFMEELCAKDRGVAQALLDAIRKLIDKIRAILVNGDRFTPRQNEALFSELDILKEMESLWADALAKAVQNRAAVGTVSEMESVVKLSAKDNEKDSIRTQIKNNLEQLNSMKPVADIKVKENKGRTKQQALAEVVSAYKKIGMGVDRQNFGFISLEEKLINGSMNYLNTEAEYAAFEVLPKVLKNGIELRDKEHKGRGYNTVTIAAPVVINGKRGNVAAVVKKTKGNRYKTHRILMPDGSEYVLEHEKTEATTSGMTEEKINGEGPDITSAVDNSINDSQQNGKKKLSIPDTEYMAAVEKGDMETVQRMVDEAAKEAGYTIKAYHGTPAEFTEFDTPLIYFSANKNHAGSYGRNVFELYVKAEKPYVTDDGTIYKENGEPFRLADGDDEVTVGWLDEAPDALEYLLSNGYDAAWDKDMEFAVSFDSYNLKSADPITYDDNGNVIPLSERFKDSDPDIRYSLPDTDSNGGKLSEGQRAYFGNSKAVNEQGRLVPVYHTSPTAGFTVFNSRFSDDQRSFFFTDNISMSMSYARNPVEAFTSKVETLDDLKKLYAVNEDAPARGMLEFEAWDADWNVLYGDLDEYIEAFENGEAENVAHFSINGMSDDVGGIEADVVENATTAEEALGLLIEEANNNLDELIMDEGYYEVYLNLENPLIIDGAEQNWDEIEGYADNELTLGTKSIEEAYDTVESLEKLLGNSYQHVMQEADDTYVYYEYDVSQGEYDEVLRTADFTEMRDYILNEVADPADVQSNLKETHNTRGWAEIAQERGHDGVIIRNIYDNGTHGYIPQAGDVYIAFSPEQIKAVTNENPTEDPDIRFSLNEPVEESGNLVAMHNVTEDKLLKTLNLEGIPMPSIAVTKADVGHSNFGSITLLFGKETIDPKNRKNKVFAADAWTPTFPRVEYESNEDVTNNIYSVAMKAGHVAFLHPVDFHPTNISSKLERVEGEDGLFEHYKNDYGVKQMFIADKGGTPVQMIIEEERIEMSKEQIEEAQYFIDNLDAEIIDFTGQAVIGPMRKKWAEKYGEQVEAVYRNYLKDTYGFNEEQIANVIENTALKDFVHMVKRAYRVTQNDTVTIREHTDVAKTQSLIDSQVNQAEYEEWLRGLFKGIVNQTGVYNGKDYYTPSGNRRSFSQTHWPVTAENIVKSMIAQSDSDRNSDSIFVGTKTIRAAASEGFNSIDEIKNASDKLQNIDVEEYEEYISELNDRLYGIIANIITANNYGGNRFMAMDSVGLSIEEACSNPTAENIKYHLEKTMWKVSNEQVSELQDIISEIANMPVNMFEAKPQRVVGFDEIKTAIIPDNSSAELKTALDDKGIEYNEYEAGNEEDRKAKVNDAATEKNVRFSLPDFSEKDYNHHGWVTANNLMSKEEMAVYQKQIADHERGDFYQIRDGLYVIPTGENGLKNVLVFTDGDWERPSIEKLIKINSADGTEIALYTGDIVYGEQHGIEETLAIYERKGLFNTFEVRDYEYSEWKRRRGEETNKTIYFDSGDEQDRRGSDSESERGGEEVRWSLPDSDDVYDYINSNETEFVDVPPTRNYEKEFARVKDQSVGELKKQVEKLQNQTKLTQGKVLDQKSIAEEVNMLIKSLLAYNDGTKKTDHKLIRLVQENAKSIYTDVKNGNIEDAAIRAWDVATEVIENLELINDEMYQEYKDLRKYLKQTKINFPDGFPHAKEFRKENFGRLVLVNKGGREVDDVYGDLLSRYPGLFDETLDNEEDMLQEIADVRSSLEPYDIVLSEEETNQLIKETAHDILDIAVHGKPWKSWADRQAEIYDERTKKLKARHKEALRDVRVKMKEKADERVKAEKEKAKEKVKAERQKGKDKLAEQKKAQQESNERKKAAAEKRRLIDRVEKDLKWLSDRLLKPTDDKHLPDGYQKAIAELLVMVDPQTARSKKLEEKYGISKKRANFLKLKAEYENIAKSESDGMIYNEDISIWCDALAETLDDAGSIAEATVEEMRTISMLIRAITHSISKQNNAFSENLKEGIAESARETIHKAKTSRKTGQRGGLPGALGTLLNESMVSPRDFFEGIGGGIHKAFFSIRKGHDKHVDNITEARAFFADLFGQYANKKKPGSAIEEWRSHKTNEKFELDGGTITMNIAQRMALYCSLKRDQAAGHIFGSGIVVAEASTMSKLKEALGAKKEINFGTTRITMEEAYDIIGTLSKEQIEIADKLQEFLNGRCADWGNEASLKMFGYKKFTEQNYFPIKSADVYLDSNFEGRQTIERIRNFGFTKGTVVNANNPIVIDDIFTVVADHVNKMSMYNAFAAPIADFTRVYNYKSRDDGGLIIESTKDVLANTYGKKVGRYITNFIADLQSNTQTRQEGFTRFVNKTLANYKKASIAANFRVALQQPTALIRAFTLIDPKYFILKNHTPELLKKAKGEDTDYKDMLEHCPISRWKSWGFSQVDMARDLDDIMMNKEWTKLDLVTMQVYGVLDLYTWSKIWGAVRAETKAKHPDVEVDSEEFYAICNERASEVFDKTQVVDSVIHRSQVMRNTDTMSKVLTSFMAEPTRTYNMVRSEYAAAMDMWADGDKAKASAKVARASSVYLFNAIACAAAAAVADALRGKDLDDDDEPEAWWELTLSNFMSNANPLNLLPVFKEVSSIWKGWDTSNMALEGIEALVKAEKGLFDKMMGESDKPWSELLRKQAEAMGMVFGVPVKNILREIESFGKIVGIDVFAAEKGEEETADKKLLDFGLIQNGSGFDNFLNGLGINLSDAERMDRDFDKTVKSLNKATKNMTAADKQEYLWKEITRGYTTEIEAGNYAAIDNMRRLLKATGGDNEKFEESVISRTKTAMKKTIGVDSVMAETYREQLKGFGLTDAVINQEVVMKSEAAKAFQLEACEDDYDGMVETIRTLYDAGLSETELDVLYYNRTKAISAKDYQTGELIAPCNGEITSTFGYRDAPTAGASSNHKGIDIAVAANSDIAAADGGKVSSVGYNSGYGYYVKISHGNGRYTMYAHLNGYYVQKGQAVSKGDIIALSGSTGVSTGPHLHFEVIENGINVDPLPYLQ